MYITDRADTNKDGISADEFKVGCGKGWVQGADASTAKYEGRAR